MRVGEILEVAIWLSGEETPEMVSDFERTVVDAMTKAEHEHGFTLGPVEWTVKYPNEDRVPEPPAHVQGIDVRLLVAEAEIKAIRPLTVSGPPLSQDLEPEHLARLRSVVRAAHARRMPMHRTLTDAECDEIIDEHGPGAAAAVVQGSVH